MNTEILGRDNEISIFDKLLNSSEPKFLAMYGRRRVGKTFLIPNILSRILSLHLRAPSKKAQETSKAKYTEKEFIITKEYSSKLRQRRAIFEHISKTKKAVITTLISTFPAMKNEYYFEEINSEVVMEDLFVKL